MDRVQPGAIGSLTHSIEAGAAWGQYSDGWIVPGGSPSRPATASDEIDETALDAFDQSHSGSLTVTIGPGEAFVDGWVARDSPTDVDVAPSTAGQTIYLGWDTSAVFSSDVHTTRDHADRVIVGLDPAFDADDPQVPLWTVSTDDDGVTGSLDERSVGPTVEGEQMYAESELGLPAVSTRGDIPDDRPEQTAATWWVTDERSLVVDDDGNLVDVSTIDTDGLVDDSVTRPKISSDAVGSAELDYTSPLTESNEGQTVTVALGDGLETDANGRVYISDSAVGSREMDLGSLAGDGLAHGGGVLFVPANAVNTSELVADAVTGSILAADAVDTQHVASDAIKSTHVQTGAVGAAEIDVDAVGVSEIDFAQPLAATGRQLDLALGDGLAVDGDGRLHLPTNAIGGREINLGALSGNALSYSGGSFDVAAGSISSAEIGADSVMPDHVAENQTFNIDVDTLDGRDATDLEQTAKERALAADFIL